MLVAKATTRQLQVLSYIRGVESRQLCDTEPHSGPLSPSRRRHGRLNLALSPPLAGGMGGSTWPSLPPSQAAWEAQPGPLSPPRRRHGRLNLALSPLLAGGMGGSTWPSLPPSQAVWEARLEKLRRQVLRDSLEISAARRAAALRLAAR